MYTFTNMCAHKDMGMVNQLSNIGRGGKKAGILEFIAKW